MDYTKFIGGLFGGFVGVFCSHPFDTIKTKHQSNINNSSLMKTIKTTNSIKLLYRGVIPPLWGIGLEKCISFGIYNNIKNIKLFKNYYSNTAVSGILSGLCCTTIVTPIEKIKINLQNDNNSNIKQIIKKNGISNLYRGWSATFFREVPGYGIYFTTYELCKNNTSNFKPYHSFIFGALSGLNAWLFIYPPDSIKTIMQNENINFIQAANKIYDNYGIKGFYRGLSLGLFRAIPLHAGVFFGYELFVNTVNKL
jgi:hypothetical protein